MKKLVAIAVLGAALLATAATTPLSWAQTREDPDIAGAAEQSPLPEALAGLTGQDRPGEVIYARRLVMSMIGSRMNLLSLMAQPGAEYHGAEATEAFLTIGFLFEVFPHLFPPQTNTMPPEDVPGDLQVTNARPVIWEDFDAFYARAMEASALAQAGLNADAGDAFRQATADLQAACDACHADFRRTRSTYGIPIPPLQENTP